MIAAILAGVAAGYGIAIPVGAIGVLLVGFAARGAWRIGAAAALGVATVDGPYALVGGVTVARVIGPVATPLRIRSRLAVAHGKTPTANGDRAEASAPLIAQRNCSLSIPLTSSSQQLLPIITTHRYDDTVQLM